VVEGYFGRMGSGKTYCMVKRTISYIKANRRAVDAGKAAPVAIYSNMQDESVLEWSQPFNSWDDLLRIRNGLVLLDELSIWAAARDFQSLPKAVASYVAQSRKHGVNVWYTAQHEAHVDAVWRRLTAVHHGCQRYGGWILERQFDPATQEKFHSRFHKVERGVYEYYNTFEVLGFADGTGGGEQGAAGVRRLERDGRRMMVEGVVRKERLESVAAYLRCTQSDLARGRTVLTFDAAGNLVENDCSRFVGQAQEVD
jgi:hypothetical protein